MSEPGLFCPPDWDSFLEDDPIESVLDSTATCSKAFAESGVDLTAYNSIASAHDVADLAATLGYDHINLVGISYGTRLAQSVIRLFPELVRTAVLDSTYPTFVDGTASVPANFQRSLEHVIDSCLADDVCAAGHPELDTVIERISERFETPQRVTVSSFDNDELDLTGVAGLVFGLLYREQGLQIMPDLLIDLAAGDDRLVGRILSEPGSGDFADAVFLAVQCFEEVPFSSVEAVERALTGIEFYDSVTEVPFARGPRAFEQCKSFHDGLAPAAANEPLRTDTPVLVLAGSFDPITPPAWGQEILATLPNSQLIEVENFGHGVLSLPCASSAARRFVDAMSVPVSDRCDRSGPFFDAVPLSLTPAALEPDLDAVSVWGAARGWLDQLNLYDPWAEDESMEVDGREWSVEKGASGSRSYILARRFEGGINYSLLLVGFDDELDELAESVLWPAAAALNGF